MVTLILIALGLILGLVILVGILIKLVNLCRNKEEKVYRSTEKGDRNKEVVYHLGGQTDEETDEELFNITTKEINDK